MAAEAWHYHLWKLAHQVLCCSSHLWGAFSSSAERTQLQEMVAGVPCQPPADHRAGIQLAPGPLALPTEGLCKLGGSLQVGAVGPLATWPPLRSVTAAPCLRQPPSGPGLDEHPYKNNSEPVPNGGSRVLRARGLGSLRGGRAAGRLPSGHGCRRSRYCGRGFSLTYFWMYQHVRWAFRSSSTTKSRAAWGPSAEGRATGQSSQPEKVKVVGSVHGPQAPLPPSHFVQVRDP